MELVVWVEVVIRPLLQVLVEVRCGRWFEAVLLQEQLREMP